MGIIPPFLIFSPVIAFRSLWEDVPVVQVPYDYYYSYYYYRTCYTTGVNEDLPSWVVPTTKTPFVHGGEVGAWGRKHFFLAPSFPSSSLSTFFFLIRRPHTSRQHRHPFPSWVWSISPPLLNWGILGFTFPSDWTLLAPPWFRIASYPYFDLWFDCPSFSLSMEFPPDSRDTGKLWTWNAGVSGLSVEYVVRTCASARPPALSIGQVAEAKLRIVTRLPHDIDHGPIVREFPWISVVHIIS